MFVTEYPRATMGAIENGAHIDMIRSFDKDHFRVLKRAREKDTEVTVIGRQKVLKKKDVKPYHKRVFEDGKLDEFNAYETLLWEAILQITNTQQAIHGMMGLVKPDLLRELKFDEIYYVQVEEIK
jgi:hypothetical protein